MPYPHGSYVFDSDLSGGFFRLDGKGWMATPYENVSNGHNYGFTTEVRFFFQYTGGEQLTFSGDDDVWIFINQRLAVDLGGLHSRQEMTLNLDTFAADTTIPVAQRITLNGLYEVALFHAERHTGQSNFKLSLTGFLPAYSECKPTCGDGKLLPGEVCDDGTPGTYVPVNPNAIPAPNCAADPDLSDPAKCKAGTNGTGYGNCAADCRSKQFCGDGIVDGTETCDNGVNLDNCGDASGTRCAPGCRTPGVCGG